MVGQSILTFSGILALSDALQTGRQVKVKEYKASTQDITLDPHMTTLPQVWKTGNISAYIPVNQNTVEFIVDIPQEEATEFSRAFGLYLENDTLFMLAKPPYPFPPGLRQVMKIQLVFQNATQIINFQYVPFYETEQDLRNLDTSVKVGTEVLRLRTDVEALEDRADSLQLQVSVERAEVENLKQESITAGENILSLLASYYQLAGLYLEHLRTLHQGG